jgi:hypothetical protein
VTEKMLSYFIQKTHQRRTLVHPRVIISVPSEITQVERRAVIDSAYRAKAAEVYLVEQAMMAAIGAGLPVTTPQLCSRALLRSDGGEGRPALLDILATAVRADDLSLLMFGDGQTLRKFFLAGVTEELVVGH